MSTGFFCISDDQAREVVRLHESSLLAGGVFERDAARLQVACVARDLDHSSSCGVLRLSQILGWSST